jgi:hypothetical protein
MANRVIDWLTVGKMDNYAKIEPKRHLKTTGLV